MARQVKKARISRLILPAISVLMLLGALIWSASQFDVQPDPWAGLPLLLLYLTNPMLVIFLITVCFRGPVEFRDYRTLLDTHRALKDGLPPPSPGPRKAIVVENVAQLLLTPVLALCLLLNFAIARNEPIAQFDLPYVPLSSMEEEPLFTYERLFGISDRYFEDRNQISRQLSLLSPGWYEVSQYLHSAQSGTQTNAFSPNPEDGKYRYSPGLNMVRFSLLIPAMSRSVAKAQLDAYRLINVYWTYEEVNYPGTDFVILAKEDSGVWQMAAVGSGKYVAVFRYGGQEKLSDHLDLLSSMVHP